MSEEALLSWITEQTAFQKEYETLLHSSVLSQFDAISDLEFEVDWNYLLKCASFLAHSKTPGMHDKALRIAQSCLQDKEGTNSSQKNSAQFILNILANRRAIALAHERGLLEEKDSSWQESFLGNMNWIKQELEHSVWLTDGTRMDVNSFQKSFWDSLNKYQSISISAPTSAGKSHLIKQWILEEITKRQETIIVYTVPTRALIAEVEDDFQKALSEEVKQSRVNITSFPFIQFSEQGKPTIYVLTQERLQLLLRSAGTKIDILIVDEAYKLADSDRGVLLQHVIEKTILSNPATKVVYISPQASNPEMLVEDNESSYGAKFEDVTVNQNLIWATQVRGAKWKLDLCYDDNALSIGEVRLPSNPSPASLKLPMLAYTLGKSVGGNIIYVNRAVDAENTAEQLCDLIGHDNQLTDQRILDLIELCQKVIHSEYKLIRALKYGVAFHYGNIPLLIREEIEGLFREGVLNYLVCTSTLVEGVNLPCKNIFIRSPKRGNGNPMNSGDFWNLAGRAGRWGKDFQGNIICVDPVQWDAPKKKKLIPIHKATEDALKHHNQLIQFMVDGTPRVTAAKKETKFLESMTSYLAISQRAYGSVKNLPWVRKIDTEQAEELDAALNQYLAVESVPEEIIINHPGISPLAMEKMLAHFEKNKEMPENFLVPYATDTDAVTGYKEVFKRLYERLTNEFGNTDRYLFRQAIATVNWMQGQPISKIIIARKRALPSESIHNTIRQVLQDIESVARYKAPKYLSCYNDLLHHFLQSIGRNDLADEVEDITLYLEMGVNTKTQLSLLNLGLSRTSAVELKTFITADDYMEQDCLDWLQNPNNNWQSRNLPEIVKREITKILKIHLRDVVA